MDDVVPVAVAVTDIHLSEKAPLARSAEKDWMSVQADYLAELRAVAGRHKVPILCGGDVFDKADPSPTLINFALDHVPEMLGVPGQHDLKFHNFDDLEDTAFGTLVKVGRIKMLSESPTAIPKAWVWGFPWDHRVEPQTPSNDKLLQIAVVHAYIWRKGSSYPGAPEKKRVAAFKDCLRGYDVAVFGDNHKGFSASLYYEYKGRTRRTLIWNNGGFMRRKIDEVSYQPRIGIIMSNGDVVLHHLESAKDDVFIERDKALLVEEANHTMQAFLKELSVGGDEPLDFRDSLRRYFDTYEVSEGARKIILESISHE